MRVQDTARAARPGSARGVATVLVSAAVAQSGAAAGALAFPAIGPVGVTGLRQLVSAAVLVPLARPGFRTLSREQWWAVIGLAAVFATMNLTLYVAVSRIGLGLAVTLEFLGPLSVALLGSRRLVDLLCAIGAGIGVYVLVLPGPSTDFLGIGVALLAGGSWAMYILMNRVAGARLPGLQATAAATCLTSLLYAPVLLWLLVLGAFADPRWMWAIVAGVTTSAIGFGLDLIALRTLSGRMFGVLASSHPLAATLAGVVILHEHASTHELVGVGLIVLVNVVAVRASRSAGTRVRPTEGGPPGSGIRVRGSAAERCIADATEVQNGP